MNLKFKSPSVDYTLLHRMFLIIIIIFIQQKQQRTSTIPFYIFHCISPEKAKMVFIVSKKT